MATKVSDFNTSGTNQRATVVVGLAFRGLDGELYVVEGDQTGGIPVTVVSGGGGPQDVNLTQVAGATALVDYGAPTANAPRVVANISVAGAAVAAGNPVPVSVSGVATAANQATEIASLASLDTKTPALVSGATPVITGLGVPAHDAILASFAATTDTYTYKTGGTGGTTVGTVVITYTDSTKAVLQTVVRS